LIHLPDQGAKPSEVDLEGLDFNEGFVWLVGSHSRKRKKVDKDGPVLDDDGKPIPGGSVFARPMGQFVLAEVLRSVAINGRSIEDAIDAIMSEVSMDIDDDPWVNVIWNPETRNIQGGKKERGLLVSLLSFSLSLKGAPKVRELNKLYRDISGNKRATALPLIEWSGTNVPDEAPANGKA